MSLIIIKAGILDSIQDEGRYGYQESGINPGGAMDIFAARLANCLLGKPMNAPVIEFHFPAPVISFSEAAVFCLTGADFGAAIDDAEIQLNSPILINKNTVLKFKKIKRGVRCYLSLLNDLKVERWLHSYSTNMKAGVGGSWGRALKGGDIISFDAIHTLQCLISESAFKVLPWKAQPEEHTREDKIEIIAGSEWTWLDEANQQTLLNTTFKITNTADRMGYRLSGTTLRVKEPKHLVSSAVTFGTLQLLPSGQLIVLMADHQTTGGYPKIANVISAHLPHMAQRASGDVLSFAITDIDTAVKKLLQQVQYLQTVQRAANFEIQKFLR